MKLAVVGVGNAGSRIVNRIRDVEEAAGRDLCDGNTLLINSTKPAFGTTEHVPEERRMTIGDVHWEIDSPAIDGDPDVAAEVAREERNEINRAFDLIEFHRIDGILVVAGLAGGTGGGAGAVVIDQLKAVCDEPVYAVGVLPAESEGQGAALAAARALRSFVERADNVILFDNDAWLDDDLREEEEDTDAIGGAAPDITDEVVANATVTGETTTEDYARVNVALAERLVTLFATGQFSGASPPENWMDPSDIMRTLDTGGVSSIGYASTDVPRIDGLWARFRELLAGLPWLPEYETDDDDEPTDAAKINRLVRRAARSELTLPCTVSSADRALIAVSGPSRVLSRKGFESGRYWLEREADIVDVVAGDEPHDRSKSLTAVVLFSNVTDVPRIEAMQEQAVGRQRTPSTDETHFDTATSP